MIASKGWEVFLTLVRMRVFPNLSELSFDVGLMGKSVRI